jgi:hypothetical protein
MQRQKVRIWDAKTDSIADASVDQGAAGSGAAAAAAAAVETDTATGELGESEKPNRSFLLSLVIPASLSSLVV